MIDRILDPILNLNIITLKDAMIALYIVAIIASIEAGVIGGLASRVGGLRKLFRITLAYKCAHQSNNKETDTTKIPHEK